MKFKKGDFVINKSQIASVESIKKDDISVGINGGIWRVCDFNDELYYKIVYNTYIKWVHEKDLLLVTPQVQL